MELPCIFCESVEANTSGDCGQSLAVVFLCVCEFSFLHKCFAILLGAHVVNELM